MTLAVVTLAAGKGSRMKSTLPKVLHPIGGKPMLAHVLHAASSLSQAKQHVVIGHQAEQVTQTLADQSINWVLQQEQKGTGHAVAQALPDIADDELVLILYGDVPLIQTTTLEKLVDIAASGQVGLLTVNLDDSTGYGRIIRNESGQVLAIVEHKDATDEQRQIKEVNTGILSAPASLLKSWLPQLSANNAQGEYYLTDIIAMAVADQIKVSAIQPNSAFEVEGVNDPVQLARLERVYQGLLAEDLMRQGVRLADPQRIDIRGSLTVGANVFIDVGCIFEGDVVLGDHVHLGAYNLVRNSQLGEGVKVESHCHIEQAQVASQCNLGPYARLRPGAQLAEGARVGNFCEIKNASLASGAKVNHLSYIGDASVGKNTNIGAGTITCNYDGVNKHKTEIGENAFIGSNSALVAPVSVGTGATVAAGSVITKNVADNQLSVARSKQRDIAGWQRPKKS